MTTQSSRAESVVGIRRDHADCVDDPTVCCQAPQPAHCVVPWLLSELEAADAKSMTAEFYQEFSECSQENIRLRSALEEAKLSLRPFIALVIEQHQNAPDHFRLPIPFSRATFGDLRRAAEVAAKLEKL